jgi:hypothetical protein
MSRPSASPRWFRSAISSLRIASIAALLDTRKWPLIPALARGGDGDLEQKPRGCAFGHEIEERDAKPGQAIGIGNAEDDSHDDLERDVLGARERRRCNACRPVGRHLAGFGFDSRLVAFERLAVEEWKQGPALDEVLVTV